MEQGSIDQCARVRFRGRQTDNALAIASLASVFVAAILIAACGGNGSGVPNQQAGHILMPQRQCTGGTQIAAIRGAIQQPPPPNCSPPPQWDIIVANPGNNSLTSYQFTTSGNATPLSTISGNTTGLNGDHGIYFDGEISVFVSNTNANTVEAWGAGQFAGGQGGNLPPYATLSGSATKLNAPYAMTENYTITGYSDELTYSINVPAAPATPSVVAQLENASGNTAPVYTISGNLTQLGAGKGLAVDSTTGQPTHSGGVYVSEGAKIVMFLPSAWKPPTPPPGGNINVAPYKTISGANTQLTNAVGLYVDQNGYLFVVNRTPDKIIVFSPTAANNATPSNTITASLLSPYGVAVDANGNVYVTNDGNPNSLTVYNNGEHGSSTLQHSISGGNTGLNNPANLDVRISR